MDYLQRRELLMCSRYFNPQALASYKIVWVDDTKQDNPKEIKSGSSK